MPQFVTEISHRFLPDYRKREC